MADVIQNMFNTREIASIFWSIIFIVITMILLFKQNNIDTINKIMKNLFCVHFLKLYFLFGIYLVCEILVLNYFNFWEVSLLKSVFLWVVFIAAPLCFRIIKGNKDFVFFSNVLKENFKIFLIVEFLMSFWTFNIFLEILLVPFLLFLQCIYMIASKEEKHSATKKFVEKIFILLITFQMIYLFYKLFNNFSELLAIQTIKEFFLPMILIIINLPFLYFLSIYTIYEQVFIRLKANGVEKEKMKRTIFLFAGLNLKKINHISNNYNNVLSTSLNAKELKTNLLKLQNKLNYQVGENYMDKSKANILICSVILIFSVLGIIVANSEVSIKDIVSFNFILEVDRIKDIITYLLSSSLVVSIFGIIFSISTKKQKSAEIYNVKKYVLYDIIHLLKKQNEILPSCVSVEDCNELYQNYFYYVYQLNFLVKKYLAKYENILTYTELHALKELQSSVTQMIYVIQIPMDDEIPSRESFNILFKKNMSIHNSRGVYTYSIKIELENYVEKVEMTSDTFKCFFTF